MKADGNRHGRKERIRQRAARKRRRRNTRWAALFAALACSGALGAIPAEAGTGGVGATSGEGATTSAGLVFSSPMRSAGATWYGPGLYGNHTACGQTLRPGTIGVAHRRLPCGTAVKFVYHGRSLVARVIDRGPYTQGNAFDLTNGARRALDFEGADRVRYAVAVGSKPDGK
jgi:rare lipoprotein A (peptidoglycan hydrolase)